MPKTLQDLRDEARGAGIAKNFLAAFKIYRLVLEAAPLDFGLRFEIADLFLVGGDKKRAGAIFQAIALHDIKAGNPLRAIVAIKILAKLGVQVGPTLEALSKTYGKGSPALGQGVRAAPADYDTPVRDDIELNYEMPKEEVVDGLAKMAAYTDNIEKYPSVVPPIAILSTLEAGPFGKLLHLLKLRRFHHGDAIINEGEVGQSLYFVARGEVLITKRVKTDEGDKDLHLARLGPGSIFGEMALISSEPRGASVKADGDADVVELTKAEVEALSREVPNVAGAMARFTRERLISNLMATNPIFKPFSEASRKQLLSRFVGHEVPGGTIFIEQGKPGNGLYLVLQGAAEVLTWNGSEYIKVAEIGPGDIVGEISLIHEEPATATVRTTAKSTLLFLAKELFHPLLEAVPELLAHFAKLAKTRSQDTESKVQESRYESGDFVEDVDAMDAEDELAELSDDDLVMV